MPRLPQFGQPNCIIKKEFIYCKKDINQYDTTGNIYEEFDFKFKKGERYEMIIEDYGYQKSYSVAPKEHLNGGITGKCFYGVVRTSGFINERLWEYFETKQERRKRIIKSFIK